MKKSTKNFDFIWNFLLSALWWIISFWFFCTESSFLVPTVFSEGFHRQKLLLLSGQLFSFLGTLLFALLYCCHDLIFHVTRIILSTQFSTLWLPIYLFNFRKLWIHNMKFSWHSVFGLFCCWLPKSLFKT